jgi:hypothetical protein
VVIFLLLCLIITSIGFDRMRTLQLGFISFALLV